MWKHVNKKRKFHCKVFLIINLIGSFTEIVSIAAIIPFMTLILSPENILDFAVGKLIVDFFDIQEYDAILFPMTIMFTITVCLSGLMRIIILWSQTKIGYGIGADLCYKCYHLTLVQPYNVHLSRNSSSIISILSNKANALSGTIIMPILTMFSSLIITIAISIALFAVHLTLMSFVVLTIGLSYFFMVYLSRKIIKRGSLIQSINLDHIINIIQESLGGIRDVLLNNLQNFYSSSFKSMTLISELILCS